MRTPRPCQTPVAHTHGAGILAWNWKGTPPDQHGRVRRPARPARYMLLTGGRVDASCTADLEILLRDLVCGDEEAWNRFVARYGAFLRRAAGEILADPSARDDAVQEALLRIRRALPTFDLRSPAAFHAWLQRIVQNTARSVARSLSGRWHVQALADDDALAAPDASEPDAQDAEVRRLVARTLECLTRLQAEVIRRRVVEGQDTGRIARDLGLSPEAVRMAQKRGLDRLRDLLTRRGLRWGPPALLLFLTGHPELFAARPAAAWHTRIPGGWHGLLTSAAVATLALLLAVWHLQTPGPATSGGQVMLSAGRDDVQTGASTDLQSTRPAASTAPDAVGGTQAAGTASRSTGTTAPPDLPWFADARRYRVAASVALRLGDERAWRVLRESGAHRRLDRDWILDEQRPGRWDLVSLRSLPRPGPQRVVVLNCRVDSIFGDRVAGIGGGLAARIPQIETKTELYRYTLVCVGYRDLEDNEWWHPETTRPQPRPSRFTGAARDFSIVFDGHDQWLRRGDQAWTHEPSTLPEGEVLHPVLGLWCQRPQAGSLTLHLEAIEVRVPRDEDF